MKMLRSITPRFASALALGCALLAFAAAPSAAQAQMKIVALNDAVIDKLSKFIDAVVADPAKKAAMDEPDKDPDLNTAIMSGASVNDLMASKHPKTAEVLKSGGYTADELYTAVLSVGMASAGVTDGTADPATAKANVDYFNANKDKIGAMMSKMK